MKASSEIGYQKTLKFLLFSVLEIFYNCMFLPPLRKFFLQILGAKIGKNSVMMNVKFFNWHHTGPKGLKIGEDCFIGDETLIDLYDSVVLEDKTTLAQRVTVLTHLNVGYLDHPLQKNFPKTSKPVVFKTGSVVGASATILPGVTVGEKSFVAAGSLVSKDVTDHTLVAGVPIKIIRRIA